MPTKITLIGAGSVVFAKNLICDILQFPELRDCRLCLMDISAERLKVAEVMARKVAAKLGVPATIEATLDRTAAIRGAKYVICTIQIGGYEPATVLDFEIPKKYGLRQTIADTLGVGGVFRALRTIPALLAIARDIAEVGAPGCLFLNYSNPMAMNCMAVDRAVGVPMVGLCHSVQGTSKQLANHLGLDYEHVTYRVAGINHMAFFLEFKYRGRDLYPLLFRLLDDPRFREEKVRYEMMRRLGYFVTESSEHQSEYTPHFIHHGDEIIRRFDIPIDEYLRRCRSIIATWRQTEHDLVGEGADIRINPQTHEYGSYIIHSMETGVARVVYGNVPNTGLITNLPARCCVEVPTLVDRTGLQPTFIGELPPQLAAICRSNVNVQELTVAAALTGRREAIYHAVMADPHTAATLTLDKIWAMCDELIEAHGRHGYFPAYAPTIPGTGRARAGTADKVFATIEPGESPAQFSLHLRNESGEPFRGPVAIERVAGGLAENVHTADVSLAAGAEARLAFSLATASAPKAFTLCAVGDDARVCGYPFEYRERPVIDVPILKTTPARGADGVATHGAEIEMEFMSTPLLAGRLWLADGALHLSLRVFDTDVRVDEGAVWNRSCLALHFRDDRGGPVSPAYYIVPKAGEGPLLKVREPQPGTAFSVQIDKAGYAVNGAVPLALAGLDPTQPFLFDLIACIGALGTAHGACRVAWNGQRVSAGATPLLARLKPRRVG